MVKHETTALLAATRDGDARAADLLFSYVYDEVHRLAQQRASLEPNLTLSTTEVVHEAYLKLVDQGDWTDRAHFMAVAARAIRQILTDRARARRALKRGGSQQPVTLNADLVAGKPSEEHALAIHEALQHLERRDADLARLVELRFYGGLEVNEVAHVMQISPRTAARQWARAKAYLHAHLS